MIKRVLSILLMTGGLLLLMLLTFPSSHVFAASSQVQIPASGFVKTCEEQTMNIDPNGILSGDCATASGVEHYSTLNLNIHVGNIDGQLTANSSGFVKSCPLITSSLQYSNGDFYLEANCYAENGDLFPTGLGLNAYISNINGSLVWA